MVPFWAHIVIRFKFVVKKSISNSVVATAVIYQKCNHNGKFNYIPFCIGNRFSQQLDLSLYLRNKCYSICIGIFSSNESFYRYQVRQFYKWNSRYLTRHEELETRFGNIVVCDFYTAPQLKGIVRKLQTMSLVFIVIFSVMSVSSCVCPCAE